MSVLVTGGSGFLGQTLARVVPDARYLSSRDLDLTNGEAVREAIATWQPETVVHLAAHVGGIVANMSHPCDFLVDNMRIDANLLAALRHNPPRHFISMLSTCMYPDRLDDSQYPMDEDLIEAGAPPPTNAAYAIAKRALWRGTLALHDQYGVPFTALIPTNLFGPHDHFDSSSSHFLAAAVHKVEAARVSGTGRVGFFGTGRALRQYVYAPDVAQLIALLINDGALNATVNVSPQEALSIGDLAGLVATAAGYGGRIEFDGTGPDGQFRKDVSTARLRSLVPSWSDIETPLAAGLSATIAWYRDHVAAG